MNRFQLLAVSAISIACLTAARALARRPRSVTVRDRGDVPGWVLITLMTAGLVTILWKLAGDQLSALFTQAMGSVTGP
jgi:glycine/D-amino acid oxidase-like deaminating enzyme